MGQHGAQILEIEQQQAIVVGDRKRDVEHALLRFVESEQACQQHRPHVGNRRAQRMPLLAIQVPEYRRATMPLIERQTERAQALVDLRMRLARLADPRQVALDVGDQHRHAVARETLGQ